MDIGIHEPTAIYGHFLGSLGQPVINKKTKKYSIYIQSKFSSGLLDFCDKLAAVTDLYFSAKQQPFNMLTVLYF